MNYLFAKLKNPDLIELLGSDMARIFYFKNEEGQSKYALIENDLPTSVKMSIINYKLGFYALSDPEQAKSFPFVIASEDIEILEDKRLRQNLVIHLHVVSDFQENIWNHLSANNEVPVIPPPSDLHKKDFVQMRLMAETLKGQLPRLKLALEGIMDTLRIISCQSETESKTAA